MTNILQLCSHACQLDSKILWSWCQLCLSRLQNSCCGESSCQLRMKFLLARSDYERGAHSSHPQSLYGHFNETKRNQDVFTEIYWTCSSPAGIFFTKDAKVIIRYDAWCDDSKSAHSVHRLHICMLGVVFYQLVYWNFHWKMFVNLFCYIIFLVIYWKLSSAKCQALVKGPANRMARCDHRLLLW